MTSTPFQRHNVPKHATDEPTVGAYAYHYGGLDPRIVTQVNDDGTIVIAIGDLRPRVPAANYKFAVFEEAGS